MTSSATTAVNTISSVFDVVGECATTFIDMITKGIGVVTSNPILLVGVGLSICSGLIFAGIHLVKNLGR